MTSFEPRPYLLVNQIQPYVWGTRGEDAFIPRLLGIEPEDDQPYAELWMGTHPNAPSQVAIDGAQMSLARLIDQHPRQALGERVTDTFSGDLPFLFKVLSTAEALSIQAHPTREQAIRLHVQHPEHYPDDNHKPELAVALDSLTALWGFKPYSGILRALERYPEMATFIGRDTVDGCRAVAGSDRRQQRRRLRELFARLVARAAAQQDELAQAVHSLADRLRGAKPLREEERLFLDLHDKYADVGLFVIFLLNLVHLGAGQGLYTPAGVPHAYLKGNIIECMANSDNVVRAGLTPKFKDSATLVDILTYEMGPPPIIEGAADTVDVIYHTPVREFQVARLRMQPGQERTGSTDDAPQILLVTQGQALVTWPGGEIALRRGRSAFIPAFLEQFWLRAVVPAQLFWVRVP